MTRTCRVLATMGLGLVLGLYGCGGSGSSEAPESSEPAASEQEEAVEEEQPAEEEAPQELGKAELEIGGCNYRYKLKEVGSFAGERNIPSFQQDGAIGFNDAGDPQLLGIDGAPLLDGAAIQGIEYWTDGLYVVALKTDDVNNTGLVSMSDGIVVPAEAATLEYATEKPEDARFVEVVYATEETDNEDECFVYSTDKLFSLGVEEGDTMYKGYAKVFDLEKRAFVDGVEITNGSRNAMKDLGDSFVVQNGDDSYTMYDATGKEIWSSSTYVSFGARSLTYQADGKSYIIDATGKESFVTEGYLNTISSTDDLYLLQDGDERKVIDSQGNLVLEDSYEEVTGEFDGLFAVTVDGKPAIIDATGKVLTDDVEEFTVSSLKPGILMYKNGAGKRCLCLSNGTLIEDVDGSMYDIDFYQDDKHLVLKSGSYDVTLSSPSVLDTALVRGKADSASSTYALYDLFTGKELLDASYESINWAGGYIYAFKDGTWTVYQARLSLKK